MRKKEKEKSNDKREFFKEIKNAILVATLFTLMFFLVFYDATSNNYAIFIVAAVFCLIIAIGFRATENMLFVFKGLSLTYAAIVLFLITLTVLSAYLGINFLVTILIILLIMITSVLLKLKKYKVLLVTDEFDIIRSDRRTIDLVVSFSALCYGMFYLLIKNISINMTYIIVSICTFYFSIYFLDLAIVSLIVAKKRKANR